MDIKMKSEERMIHEAFSTRYLEINGIKKEEIEKAEVLDVLVENVNHKNENKELKSELAYYRKHFPLTWSFVEIPKLIVDKKEHKFTFTSQGQVRTAVFEAETNEYLLLMHFVQNPLISFTREELSKKEILNPSRNFSNPQSKRREADTITAIKKKLGENIILKVNGHYVFLSSAIIK